MMKADPSAAQTFLVLKKAFLPELPLNKKKVWNFFVFQKRSRPPPQTLVYQRFQLVQKENIGLMWAK